MATFYLDWENGNDAADGLSFANRWKTYTSGATAARIAPGDTIRVMASPAPTLVGSCGWTQNSNVVTLPAAVTADIENCDAIWTAAANVTATLQTTSRREGTGNAQLAIAAGHTTGLAGYKALAAPLNLSAYQQICFWFRTSVAIANGTTMSLRLCSDAAGAVSVATLAVPAIPSTNKWVAVVVDTGGALPATVNSVALYVDTDMGAVTVQIDNIFASKAPSAADSLTLRSLIAKETCLYWQSGATYAVGQRRKPTPPNRNGFQYKVQSISTGVTGGAEPSWPAYWGGTVTDGGVVWVCERCEDTWFPIASIVGTTVTLDGYVDNTPTTTGTGKYFGDTESIATYKREPINLAMVASSVAFTTGNALQDSGDINSDITITGGWNRTDMSTQDGESWFSSANGFGQALLSSSRDFVTIENINGSRCQNAINASTSSGASGGRTLRLKNCHATGCSIGMTANAQTLTAHGKGYIIGVVCANNFSNPIDFTGQWDVKAFRADGHAGGSFPYGVLVPGNAECRYRYIEAYGNTYAVFNGNSNELKSRIYNARTGFNRTAGIVAGYGGLKLWNWDYSLETTPVGGNPQINYGVDNQYIQSHNDNNVAGAHKTYTFSAVIEADATTVHTGGGKSWRVTTVGSGTTTHRNKHCPIRVRVGVVKLSAGVSKNVSIWYASDTTGGRMKLCCEAHQLAGMNDDVETAEQVPAAINTWYQSDAITLTSTEDGLVEIIAKVWDTWGNTQFWLDDLTVT